VLHEKPVEVKDDLWLSQDLIILFPLRKLFACLFPSKVRRGLGVV